MIKAGIALIMSLLLCFSASSTMARSPLPNLTGTKILTPVCAASGLAERDLQDLQQALCAEAARLLMERTQAVEVLALNDPRLTSSNRLIIGLRAHVETVDGIGPVLTINGQIAGDQRRVPTAAHSAPFTLASPHITPAVLACLRKVLHEQGLL